MRRPIRSSILLVLLAGLLALCTAALRADQVVLNASRDNTLYEDPDGRFSNGAGDYFFAGHTKDPRKRRGVIQFNLGAAGIPAGSTITNVALQLYMSKSPNATARNVTLHRLLASWGEGTSNAPDEEGKGADPPATGDATWVHRFYPNTNWSAPGGQFLSSTSAVQAVSGTGNYSWSSAGMLADVRMWFTNAGTNFGWLVRGVESGTETVKRFNTRTHPTVAQRPKLIIGFTPPQPVGACCMPAGDCQLLTSNQCFLAGGTYQGDGTSCTPNPCVVPTGACCLSNGTCIVTNLAACLVLGGNYNGDGSQCLPDLCPVLLTPFVDPLPIPGPLAPVSGSIGGAATYDVAMNQVQQKLHRDLPLTTVWAYGSAFPGPLIEATVNQPVTVRWRNNLRDGLGNLRTNHYLHVDHCLHGPDMLGDSPRTVVHLHGGKVSPQDDGYPEDTILPGQSRTNYYGNEQPPGTIWFHDHALGITRLNVYMGLAGLYLLRDAFEQSLGLPSGPSEIPLVIQDRKFNPDGSLKYPQQWVEHFFGDTLLVNGKVWPYLIVRQGKYRFRLLNGSTSRTYTLGLSSGATFHQIGTDAGLLRAPVPLTQLTIMPGERADVVMDFAGHAAGSQVFLTNGATAPFPSTIGGGVISNVMKFIVTNIAGHTAALPAMLRPIERLYESNSVQQRHLVLRKGADPCTGARWLINDLGWDDITEFPVLGSTEVWSFINRSGVAHPMHLHLVLMQILDRQPFVFTNGMDLPTGPRVPPPANEDGWKDTVRVGASEIVRVIARFEGFTGLYPYHCHILEHEDHEMMRQFQVVLPPVFTDIRRSGSNVILSFRTTTNWLHFLERRNSLSTGNWTLFTSGIPALGPTGTVIDPWCGPGTNRFYRLGIVP